MDLLAYMLASGGDDNSLKLWFWLIVGVIFLIKKAIELLKPDEKDEEPSVPDTENHHEKRVREVIAEMRRATPQPQQTQPAAPARAPRPSAPPVELPSPAVARKPQRIPAPAAAQPEETARQTAQNVLERYVKATEEARQSMRSLSDAEQAALQRLQKREMKEHLPDLLPSSAAVESPSLKKFPSPPQISESGCSLSGNPWKTQSITKRILQR